MTPQSDLYVDLFNQKYTHYDNKNADEWNIQYIASVFLCLGTRCLK